MQVAFGPDGAPSRALDGFCKKNGVSPADVTKEADAKGTEYVWAVVRSQGRPAAEVCSRSSGICHIGHALDFPPNGIAGCRSQLDKP